MAEKPVIYQVFTRLFGNDNPTPVPSGTIEQNGSGKMADFTQRALNAIHDLGCTHIWYTGLIRHASRTDHTTYGLPHDHPAIVKGEAGSPYAITDYYDIDPDLATDVPSRMKEFENLVRRTHRAGLKIIIDFVPNHVARQYHSVTCPPAERDLGADDDRTQAFSPHNNFYYIPQQQFAPHIPLTDSHGNQYVEFPARATGNDCFHPSPGTNDWYETIKLNYGIDYLQGRTTHFDPVPDTWHKMLHILQYWAAKGIDAFRCDMAEMVPCAFWAWAIPRVKQSHPHITFIAEVYDPGQYRNYLHNGHFDTLYDKVGLYDTLRAVTCGHQSAATITHAWQAVDDIHTHMLSFLENHDEQRVASPQFAADPRRTRAPLLIAALLRDNPVMIYFGQELGEPATDAEGFSGHDGRTTIFDYWTVDTVRRWRDNGRYTTRQLTDDEAALQDYHRTVLRLCQSEKAIREGAFFDIMYANHDNAMMNTHRQYAFLRHADHDLILIVANFDDRPAETSIIIPAHAFDTLALPTSPTARTARDLLTGHTLTLTLQPDSPITLTLPALGGIVLKMEV